MVLQSRIHTRQAKNDELNFNLYALSLLPDPKQFNPNNEFRIGGKTRKSSGSTTLDQTQA